jgi:RNA polymerase sigma-70 factor (ECF subfamily)
MANLLPFTRPASDGASPDDATLVLRAIDGADWARGALFSRHAPDVMALLTRLLSSTADAEDATQDTFVEALRDLRHLRTPGDFSRWVRRIAVHQAHRRFRKRKLLAVLGFDGTPLDATLDQLADDAVSPELRAELVLVQKALERRPVAERTAWVLRHVEGFELTEIAEALELSLATVKRKLLAAQEALAEVPAPTLMAGGPR